jgi:hypothetical protein
MNELLDDFTKLDKNAQLFYLSSLIVLLIILPIDNSITNKLIWALLIVILVFIFHTKNINKSISKFTNFIDQNKYPYVKKNLNILSIYLELNRFYKLDRFNYNDSMNYCNKFLQLYEGFNNNTYIIDILEDYKDNTLNSLNSIIYSIPASTDYFADSEVDILNKNILSLKQILDSMMFDIYNLARINYEKYDINVNSMPISFDQTTPRPFTKLTNNFAFYNGFILY